MKRLLTWKGWTIGTLALGLVVGTSSTWGQDATPKPDAPKAEDPKPAAPAAARQGNRGQRGPVVVSPEVSTERKVTFRVLAPKADEVTLNAGDIPNGGGDQRQARAFTKGENGVWELTLGPINA